MLTWKEQAVFLTTIAALLFIDHSFIINIVTFLKIGFFINKSKIITLNYFWRITMRKKFIVLIGIIVLSAGLNAQEQNSETLKPFYFGLGWSNIQTTGDFWGTIDFGFLLYRNEAKRFNIRNSILFDVGELKNYGNEYGIFSLSDKIIIETLSLNKIFRYYSYLQGGIGIYGNENIAFFEKPLAYNFGVGFGLDIFIEKNASIFFDYTGLFNILENKKFDSKENFNPKFQMGIRYYF